MSNKTSTPTIHILLKAEKLHNGVLRQLFWVRLSHTGVTGAGKHMAPVLPTGIDPALPNLQEKTSLDAGKDAVGEINLV